MKYKHKHSSGIDKEWSWIDVGNNTSKDELEDVLHELSEKYNWSEHYRGINYELEEYPPVSVIEEEIKSAESSIKWHLKRIRHLKEMIEFAKAYEVHHS